LKSVEDMLNKLNTRKKQLSERLADLTTKSETLEVKSIYDFNSVGQLDGKIEAISEQTMTIEKDVQLIKEEPVSIPAQKHKLLEMLEPTEEYNVCLKTLFGHQGSVESLDFESANGVLASG
jgi:predicted nuclease with TOPRIM domain